MRRAVFIAALAALAGCSWIANATRPATESVGRAILTPDQEQQLGAQLAAQVKQQEKVLNDPAAQQFVQQVAGLVVAAIPAKARKFPFDFTVLDKPGEVNAFTLPGGHIFVYSGLLQTVDSEAELAGVLGHECAHTTLGHVSDNLAADVGSQELQQLALGSNPNAILALGTEIARQGYLAAYSRKSEFQADEVGVRYLSAAGYDPSALPRFFDKLNQLDKSQPNVVSTYLASHPPSKDRARDLQAQIQNEHLGGTAEARVGGLPQVQASLGRTPVGQR